MHVLVTDSGVGGLSVVAYAEALVRARGAAEPVTLTFANAAPANDYGYNAMPSKDEKLRTFDRFLRNVTDRFAPDSIYVACNTLSVLLPETPFCRAAPIPVKGIVETGAGLLLRELQADPAKTAIVFGTRTTIDAGAYPRFLEARGVPPSRIVSQACPGLADVISEDREGSRSAAEVRRWVGAALANAPQTKGPVAAVLACTHYGYRRAQFAEAFAAAGVEAIVIDPNERAATIDLFPPAFLGGGENRNVEVEFVTRYAIPDATVETLSRLLTGMSPRTVVAMRGYVHVPDLF